MTDKPTRLLISYWPLLNPMDFVDLPGDQFEAGNSDKISEMQDKLNAQSDTPPISAVMWATWPFDSGDPNDMPIPIFIMGKAEAVAKHLEEWIEGDNDRFQLHIQRREGKGYTVLLIPDIQKSIDRWKLARMMYHEEVITDNEFHVLYRVLGSSCPVANTFDLIQDKLWPRTMLGFLDVDKVDPQDIRSINPEDIKIVGPFKLVREETPQSKVHFDDFFEGNEKPVDPRFQNAK